MNFPGFPGLEVPQLENFHNPTQPFSSSKIADMTRRYTDMAGTPRHQLLCEVLLVLLSEKINPIVDEGAWDDSAYSWGIGLLVYISQVTRWFLTSSEAWKHLDSSFEGMILNHVMLCLRDLLKPDGYGAGYRAFAARLLQLLTRKHEEAFPSLPTRFLGGIEQALLHNAQSDHPGKWYCTHSTPHRVAMSRVNRRSLRCLWFPHSLTDHNTLTGNDDKHHDWTSEDDYYSMIAPTYDALYALTYQPSSTRLSTDPCRLLSQIMDSVIASLRKFDKSVSESTDIKAVNYYPKVKQRLLGILDTVVTDIARSRASDGRWQPELATRLDSLLSVLTHSCCNQASSTTSTGSTRLERSRC